MSRYIDAEKIEYEEMLYPRGNGNYEECHIAYRDQIDDIPTADVRENVKGEWIFPYGDKKYKRCSACGKTFYSIPSTSNFCPNCGAQMVRGES